MIEATALKKQKKKWFNIIAGPEFGNREIGETLVNEGAVLVCRTIDANLAYINQDPKSQNVKIKFRIKEVKGNDCLTEVISYEMLATYIKRVIKPGKEKIDDSFTYSTKDNVNVAIKTLILTKAKTKHSILSNIRDKSHEFLREYCKRSDYENLIINLASHTLQKDLKNTLKKVYPLGICEIRMMQKL